MTSEAESQVFVVQPDEGESFWHRCRPTAMPRSVSRTAGTL